MSRGARTPRANAIAGNVAGHQRFVVHFLAADRFNRKDVSAGAGVQFERAQQQLAGLAVAHHGRPQLLANVGRGHAQSAGQAVLLVRLDEMRLEDLRQLHPPLGPFGHGRQELEFEDESGRFEADGSRDHLPADLFVVRAHLWPGRLSDLHCRQGEIDLGVDPARADLETEAAAHRPRRDAEDEIVCALDREIGEDALSKSAAHISSRAPPAGAPAPPLRSPTRHSRRPRFRWRISR